MKSFMFTHNLLQFCFHFRLRYFREIAPFQVQSNALLNVSAYVLYVCVYCTKAFCIEYDFFCGHDWTTLRWQVFILNEKQTANSIELAIGQLPTGL